VVNLRQYLDLVEQELSALEKTTTPPLAPTNQPDHTDISQL
jgi:hypothetical protein